MITITFHRDETDIHGHPCGSTTFTRRVPEDSIRSLLEEVARDGIMALGYSFPED